MIDKSAVDNFLSSLSGHIYRKTPVHTDLKGTHPAQSACSKQPHILSGHDIKCRQTLHTAGQHATTPNDAPNHLSVACTDVSERGMVMPDISQPTPTQAPSHVHIRNGSGFNLVVVGGTGGLLLFLSFVIMVFFTSFLHKSL